MTAAERAERHYIDVIYSATDDLNRAIARYMRTVADATRGYERQLAETAPALVAV